MDASFPARRRRPMVPAALLCWVTFGFGGLAAFAGDAVPGEGVYDPAHPDYRVLARDARPHDLLGLGNRPASLVEAIRPSEQLQYQAFLGSLPVASFQFHLRPPLPAASSRPGGTNYRASLDITLSDGAKALLALLPTKSAARSIHLSSTMDADRGRSLSLLRDEVQGDVKTKTERLHFDYDDRDPAARPAPVARVSGEKINKNTRKSKPITGDPYAIPPSVQDSLSAFYYARTLPLERVGDSEKVLLATKNGLEVLSLTVLGREVLDCGPAGQFDCLIVEPRCDGDGAQIVEGGACSAKLWMERNTRIVLKIGLDYSVKEGLPPVQVVAPLTNIDALPVLAAHRMTPPGRP